MILILLVTLCIDCIGSHVVIDNKKSIQDYIVDFFSNLLIYLCDQMVKM